MGYMNGVAKVLNKQPKLNSKSHKEKENKRLQMLKKKVVCKKCKNGNVTLYRIEGNYYCKDCKTKKLRNECRKCLQKQ